MAVDHRTPSSGAWRFTFRSCRWSGGVDRRYVKLLLPPRQSRGNSHWGLEVSGSAVRHKSWLDPISPLAILPASCTCCASNARDARARDSDAVVLWSSKGALGAVVGRLGGMKPAGRVRGRSDDMGRRRSGARRSRQLCLASVPKRLLPLDEATAVSSKVS